MRKFVMLAAVAVFVLQGYSQSTKPADFKKKLYIGAGAGVVFSNVDFQPKVSQVNRQGIAGGISVKYISENHLGLIGEISYTQRGWKEDFPNNPDYGYNRMLNYIEMPLMTHIYFGRKLRFIINLGPQMGYLIGNSANMSAALSQAVANAESSAATEEEKKQIGPQYKQIQRNLDYGLIGGLGLEFQSGIGSFNLEGRYYFGLGDMFNTSVADKDPFSRAASRVIYARLTYYIPFN